jgi:hypothetical protein
MTFDQHTLPEKSSSKMGSEPFGPMMMKAIRTQFDAVAHRGDFIAKADIRGDFRNTKRRYWFPMF